MFIKRILALLLLGLVPLCLSAQLRDGAIYFIELSLGGRSVWPANGEEADRVLLQLAARSESNGVKFRWRAVQADRDWFYLIHEQSGLALTLRNRDNRGQLWLQPPNNSEAQKFRFSPVEGGNFEWKSKWALSKLVTVNLENNSLVVDREPAHYVQWWKLKYAYEQEDSYGQPFNFNRAYKNDQVHVYIQYYGQSTAYGVIEWGHETYVFKGSAQPQSNGKVLLKNEYFPVPKGTTDKETLERNSARIGDIIIERNGTAISFVSSQGRRTVLNQLFASNGNEKMGVQVDAGFQGYHGIGLTGLWKDDNGMTYYIHQMIDSNSRIVWFAENNTNSHSASANVFTGAWRRQTNPDGTYVRGLKYEFEGDWVSMPKGNTRGQGYISVKGDWDTLDIIRNRPEETSPPFPATRLYRMRYLQLKIIRLTAQSADACDGMDFYGETRFYDFQRKTYDVVTGNDIQPQWVHQAYWPGNRNVPVAIIIRDKDGSIFCGGGDDQVDINPLAGDDNEERTFNLYLSIKPNGTIQQMNRAGNRGTPIGKVEYLLQDDLTTYRFAGNNSPDSDEESAIIEFQFTYSYIKN